MTLLCTRNPVLSTGGVSPSREPRYRNLQLTFGADPSAQGGLSAATQVYWLVPHFEKILYDKSQLLGAARHTSSSAWSLTSEQSQAVTGSDSLRTITEEILDYVVREMTDSTGVQMLRTQRLAFYSTQDADRESEEGRFLERISPILNRDCLHERNVLTW